MTKKKKLKKVKMRKVENVASLHWFGIAFIAQSWIKRGQKSEASPASGDQVFRWHFCPNVTQTGENMSALVLYKTTREAEFCI